MIKCFKVMLLPNNKQRTKLHQYAGAARFAYNWAIAEEQNAYALDKHFISNQELRKKFTVLRNSPEYLWLRSISNNVTKQAIKDACIAYGNFFKHVSKFPKFKSKKQGKFSFYQDPIKLRFTSTHVKLEGLAKNRRNNRQKLNFIKLAEVDRILVGVKYYNPRITFDGLNWWISVGIDVPEYDVGVSDTGVGIDLGIKDLAVCSDGNIYQNINRSNYVRKLEKRKKRLQRSISRKYLQNKKGESYCKTNNIKKSEKLLLKVNHRLTNTRQNYLHQTTTEIVNRKPRFIVLEDLNVAGMMKNKHLSNAVQQQGLYQFRLYMTYKCQERSIPLLFANRWFPSSKLCSCCGNIKQDLKLSDRIYHCATCGNTIDRDYQASINLRNCGEQMLI